MRKIPTLFERGENHEITPILNPQVTWAIRQDMLLYVTQKHDGTACMVKRNRLYRRHTLNVNKPVTAPYGWMPAQTSHDDDGKWPGWVPVGIEGAGDGDKHYLEAWDNTEGPKIAGTYEMCGPKVNVNPESLSKRILIKHGSVIIDDFPFYTPPPSTEQEQAAIEKWFNKIKKWFEGRDIEGVVFYHRNGKRMTKIKKRDYGLNRNPGAEVPELLAAETSSAINPGNNDLPDTSGETESDGSPPSH